jgi:hypothetical protein
MASTSVARMTVAVNDATQEKRESIGLRLELLVDEGDHRNIPEVSTDRDSILVLASVLPPPVESEQLFGVRSGRFERTAVFDPAFVRRRGTQLALLITSAVDDGVESHWSLTFWRSAAVNDKVVAARAWINGQCDSLSGTPAGAAGPMGGPGGGWVQDDLFEVGPDLLVGPIRVSGQVDVPYPPDFNLPQ